MRGASLRLKINAAILLAFVAAAAAFAGVLTIYINERQNAAHNRTRTLLAVLAAHRLETLAPLLDAGERLPAARDILNRLVTVEGVTEAALFDASGTLLASAGPENAAPLARDADGRLPTGRGFIVADPDGQPAATMIEPIRTAGRDAGFLRMRYTLKDIAALNQHTWIIFALAAAGAYVFLAGLLNLMLHRFVLRPVDALRQALTAVEAGDLDQEMPVTTNDALGRLAAAFNAMAARLRETSLCLGESRAEVEDHRHSLARRVEERTAELARTNARLLDEIDARARAEGSLSRLLALYKAILESTAEAVVCVAATPGRDILAVNRRYLDLWGLPDDWAGQPDGPRTMAVLNQLVDTEAAAARFNALMGDEQSLVEAVLERRDGRWLERRSGPIRQDGVYIGRVFSFVDVTERRQAEQTLRQALAQRDAVLGNTQIGLATTHADICTEINARGAEILGSTREEILGTPLADLLADSESYEELARKYDARLAAEGSISNECTIRRRDGAEIWLRFHGKSVSPDEPGRDVVWAFDDITAEKKRQASLEQARAEAEEASRAKGSFLAVMSHEIRTPLNAVIGLSEELLNGETAPERCGHLKTIKEAADHLLGVVNDILDFSKIEAGKLVLERLDFDVREIVGEAARTMEHQARQKGLDFIVSVAEETPAVLRGDPGRLRQVLLNLLGNAVKFTDAGSVTLRLEPVPATDTPPGRVGLSALVADTGIGVEPERLEALFESFNQGADSMARRFGGTGLGLAISRQLVERMGGRIEAQSRPGEGSLFRFTVFMLPGNAANLAAASPATPVLPIGRIASLRILLVEDNALNAAVTRLHLDRMGHVLTVAESAREAYALLARERFDVVLMDIEMPEIDGITATRTIRAGGPPEEPALDPGLPVVAVTAHALEDVRQQCQEAGMDAFVTKPVNYKLLQQTLADVVHGKNGAAPAAPLPAPAMLFDPRGARDAMGISWQQYADLAQVSFTEGERRLAETAKALAAGDFEQARLAAHTFKGTAATLGAYACRQAAVTLEGALRDENAAQSRTLLDRLERLWEDVRRAVKDWHIPDGEA